MLGKIWREEKYKQLVFDGKIGAKLAVFPGVGDDSLSRFEGVGKSTLMSMKLERSCVGRGMELGQG
jgi:hypothetical protein